MEEKKIRKIGGQRENSLCAGGNAAGAERWLEGALKSSMHREVALSCSMFAWIWKMFLG